MTTVEEKAEGQKADGEGGSGRVKAQPRARAHARAAVSRAWSAVTWLVAVAKAWWARRGPLTDTEKAAPSVRRSSLWREAPPSPADIWAHLRAGAFAPGANPAPVEWAGMAYGAVVLVVAVALYGLVRVIAHPARLLAVTVVIGLVVVTA